MKTIIIPILKLIYWVIATIWILMGKSILLCTSTMAIIIYLLWTFELLKKEDISFTLRHTYVLEDDNELLIWVNLKKTSYHKFYNFWKYNIL